MSKISNSASAIFLCSKTLYITGIKIVMFESLKPILTCFQGWGMFSIDIRHYAIAFGSTLLYNKVMLQNFLQMLFRLYESFHFQSNNIQTSAHCNLTLYTTSDSLHVVSLYYTVATFKYLHAVLAHHLMEIPQNLFPYPVKNI